MDALSLLRLQIEWGADEALDESPVDRLRPIPAPGASGSVPVRTSVAGALARGTHFPGTHALGTPIQGTHLPGTHALGTPVERAIRAAAQAESLEGLKAAILEFPGCPLRDMATHIVFASGDPDAGLLLIGGPPGADEDRSGMPFAGREGDLLDRMLASMGFARASMLLSPLIPWRPPGGRVPNPGELRLYRPFLMGLIALTAPSRIVLFGALAASTVLGAGQRGRTIAWIPATIEGRNTPVLILPALADLLKTPVRRKDAWTGLRLLRRALDAQREPELPDATNAG